MRITDVDAALLEDFLAYVSAHAPEHDDSFALPEDLATFDPAREPAVAALGESGVILGAASVMLAGYATEGNARFRILHAVEPAAYAPLLDRVRTRLPGKVRRAFLFLPPQPSRAVLQALRTRGFHETRRAYILGNADLSGMAPRPLPAGFSVAEATPDAGAQWAAIVNAAFGDQPGRYDMKPGRAREILSRERVVREATLVAMRDDTPVGVALVVADAEDEGAIEIETLAVMPEVRGRGLGAALLRESLGRAARRGFRTATLSVSATNEAALALYRGAGFGIKDVRVCWECET